MAELKSSAVRTKTAEPTPGPWSFEPIPASASADCLDAAFWIVAGDDVLATVDETVRGEGEANACVMAAAKDLLAALRLAADALDKYSDVNDGGDGRPTPNRAMSALQDIGVVLARAEGRS